MAIGFLAYAGITYVALVLTSLVAPVPLGWFVVGAALAVTLVVSTWLWRGHCERMILLPLVGLTVWVSLLALAGWLFGWTA
jgi:hypothetical protein